MIQIDMESQVHSPSTPLQSPLSPKPPSNHKLLKIILLVVVMILIAVIAVSAYLGYQANQQVVDVPIVQPAQPSLPSSTPTSQYQIEDVNDQTKRYIDNDYHFSFDFPSKMIIRVEGDMKTRNIHIQNPPIYEYQTHPEGETASIYIRMKDQSETLESVIDPIVNPVDVYEKTILEGTISSQQKTIGNFIGYEITGSPGQEPGKEFYTVHNDYVIRVSVSPIAGYSEDVITRTNNLYSQILSTFRFVEEE